MQFPKLETLLLVVGASRSGTTLVGSLLDAHPQIACANESEPSRQQWRESSSAGLARQLYEAAAGHRRKGRPSGDYRYEIRQREKNPNDLRVIGDKIYNPSLLMLHGDHRLTPRLEQATGLELRFINVMRHPADAISTMHRLSGAPLSDRLRWYFLHISAAQALKERMAERQWLDLYLEDVIDRPEKALKQMSDHLSVDRDKEHETACGEILYRKPKRTRERVAWPAQLNDELKARAKLEPLLSRYFS